MTLDKIRKIYIEATARCNLACGMCPRNGWFDEEFGSMDAVLYDDLIRQAHRLSGLETIFFGGVAEPLAHPGIIDMVRKAKRHDLQVELISNGSMLDEDTIEGLLKAGLDTLWVSVDRAHLDSRDALEGTGSYAKTKANLLAFNVIKRRVNPAARLGIAFVAMKSNIADLPEIVTLAGVMGAFELKISNVIPYTQPMQEEMLYRKSLTMMKHTKQEESARTPLINMPITDFDELPGQVLASILRSGRSVRLGDNLLERRAGHCQFIESDSLFVKWNGDVAPCIALLHNNRTFLYDVEREIRACSFGNIARNELETIWNSPEYSGFRTRVRDFGFSPCTVCGSCSYVETNQEDCFGNPYPTCGGCLWAEGFAQCP